MPINILMPALSPTMTEGNLAKWLKKEGDTVKAGDVIAEIETDKATMEVEAVDEGKIGRILVAAGTEGVKVNDVIAVLLEEGESAADIAATPQSNPEPAPKAAQAKPQATSPHPNPPPKMGEGTTPKPAATSAPPTSGEGRGGGKSRVFASPLARRIAEQKGIDLSSLAGSGPNGRVVRADLDKAPVGRTAPGAAAQKPATLPGAPSFNAFGEPEFELIPHTTIRKTIARRLQESKQFVPHFYLTVDCELDRLLALREDANAGSAKEGPNAYKLSVNDFMIKAYAIALRQVPKANASWSDEGIKQYKSSDISVAVAIPNGLVTPIIRNAEAKTLTQISAEMKELAGRAKAGKLKPEDYTGGSGSLSNLGMFGVKSFSAIINPPQATILAIGAGEQRAVVKNGQLAVATVMSATLAVDHRAVDGALGAELLAAFKRLVESPAAMLV
ncbi:pyruvate dehydrogenase complex dihydrolipoamide acetyltransferase [Dongia sp. agr-C8]